MNLENKEFNNLFQSIAQLIDESRQQVAVAINSELTMLYWRVGKYIKSEVLDNKDRAPYGGEIIDDLSIKLTDSFGKGWNRRQLYHCLHTVETFPEKEIVHTLCTQLSWSHIREFIQIKDELKRTFYIELCKNERWSVRVLRKKIDSMLYERTALSKKPEELIKQELKTLKESGLSTPDLVFRDPYVLDFLGLKDTYSEKDLETAILKELQQFIIELGTDFSFLARQKRITIDNEDFYIDLLFYHRNLKCLVALDLKLGKFKAAYKGQMELYLKWLNKYDRREGENSPIGLILCAEKSNEQIELLELNDGNIRVAEYITNLPSKDLLAEKLHQAYLLALESSNKTDKE